METNQSQNHPGVFIPPPFIYITVFLVSLFIQRLLPIDYSFLHGLICKVLGVVLLLLALSILAISFRQFLLSKNTVITYKPSTSLETNGIYTITRNPMYLGMTTIYLGLILLFGNWWSLILLPVVIIIIQEYVIKREEKYLEQAYGQSYLDYKRKVRRWL